MRLSNFFKIAMLYIGECEIEKKEKLLARAFNEKSLQSHMLGGAIGLSLEAAAAARASLSEANLINFNNTFGKKKRPALRRRLSSDAQCLIGLCTRVAKLKDSFSIISSRGRATRRKP